MIYEASPVAIGVFVGFILLVVGLSAWLGRRATSAAGYFAAHGEIHWFVNGIAFAGDYLSAASFLGICGMIAFYGYDGFLYSIGYLAGWIVALFVIAEPLKRLGKFHLRRRARQPLQLARHQAGRGHQHAGRQPLLPDPADGRRRRAGQAAARLAARRPAWCMVGVVVIAHRRHRRHGVDDLGAVHQGVAARPVLRRPDGPDPAPRPVGRRRRRRVAVRGASRPPRSWPARRSRRCPKRRLGRQALRAAAGSRRPGASRSGARRRATAVAWLTETQTRDRDAGRREAGRRPAARQAATASATCARSATSRDSAGRPAPETGPLGPAGFLRRPRQARSIQLWGSERDRRGRRRDDDRLLPRSRRAGDDLLGRRQPARRSPASAAPSCSTSSTSSR